MKMKIIAIFITSMFLLTGFSTVIAKEKTKTQESTTYHFVRLEMKEGKLVPTNGLGWPAPFMLLSEILSKLFGKNAGVVLWTEVECEVTEGELIVKPINKDPITLYPGEKFSIKVMYAYIEIFSGPLEDPVIGIINGRAIDFTILN
jgi:hypothetical protein